MPNKNLYIKRCFDLALLGSGSVSPNPMVGAVLVYKDRIIGEGYHGKYGGPHAEVAAVNSVKQSDKHLIPESTFYVSLEPCCIFGKTPPCTNLILKNKIKHVVISTLDSTPGVDGKGIQILKDAGVHVEVGVLEEEGQQIFQQRNIFVTQNRPRIILKYAQTKDGFFAPNKAEQHWISNKYSKRLVHKWRSEIDAILIGTNTAITDNPSLTNRLFSGKSPLRLVIDKDLRIPKDSNIFDGTVQCIVFTKSKNIEAEARNEHIELIGIDFNDKPLSQILSYLHNRKIASLLVEGGIQLLNSFIEENLWDEARVLIGDKFLKKGKSAPILPFAPSETINLDTDKLMIYHNFC